MIKATKVLVTVTDDLNKVYISLSGDQVALTDIRIRS